MGLLRREGEIVRIAVDGMTCGHCVSRVRDAIASLDGVDDVDVSLDEGRVDVRYDPDRTTVDRLREAIEGAGYRPR